MGLFGKKKEKKVVAVEKAAHLKRWRRQRPQKQLLGLKCWDLAVRSAMRWKRPPERHLRN